MTDVTLQLGQDVVYPCIYPSIVCFFFQIKPKRNWSTHEAFWSLFIPGNVYLIYPGFFCLSVCPSPPFLPPSSFLSVSLSLLSLSDPPWWFQCLRIGWLIPALDGWQTSSLHTGVQQGLHSALTLWWITGLLIHTVETLWLKKRERWDEKGKGHVKIAMRKRGQ